MRKHIIIAALLAATMATAPAFAQRDNNDRSERRAERQAERRAERQAQPARERSPEADRPQRNWQPAPVQRVEAQPAPQREFRQRPAAVDGNPRGDRGDGWRNRRANPQNVAPPVQAEQRFDSGNRNWQGRGRPQAQPPVIQNTERRNDARLRDRNGGGRPDVGNLDRRDNRAGNWNQNNRGNQYRDRNWNGRDDNWRRNDRRYAGQNWNRDWRRDQRYNWQNHRSYNRDYYRLPRYYSPYGYNRYQRFSIGITLGSPFFAERYWIDDPYSYRLPEAYPPYRWVRYYNDALLIDERSGLVVDVIYDIFW